MKEAPQKVDPGPLQVCLGLHLGEEQHKVGPGPPQVTHLGQGEHQVGPGPPQVAHLGQGQHQVGPGPPQVAQLGQGQQVSQVGQTLLHGEVPGENIYHWGVFRVLLRVFFHLLFSRPFYLNSSRILISGNQQLTLKFN